MSVARVWAPQARSVELERGGRRQPMRQTSGGWWQADAPLAHGDDYAFRVDGDGPFPDPRSPWQPQGVHGPSRHVDHARFAWHDGGWRAPPLASALVYELHVGTFTAEGSFDGAISR
ncbi:MAG: malto-oligosyltrehalose trehalohydrolase, partial [Gammaproteobacteria bacterium]